MRASFVSFSSSSSPFRNGLGAGWLLCSLTATFLCIPALGQESSKALLQTPLPLVTQAVDESQRTVLKGNTHPLARPQFDLGTAPATLPMQRMLLVLKRSDAQEAALLKLLDDQQDKRSPNYHKWMTPEQFGAQFGPTDTDMQTITSWLQSHGFQVGSTKGRTVLEFSGSASQVQEAFHTTIHRYIVNGEQHWANASDPSIPAALAPAVAGIASMNNFPRKAMNVPAGVFMHDKTTGKTTPVHPMFTYPGGCDQDGNCYLLGPYDFATIYDVQPLWNAGLDGTDQTIAIVGESNINPQDVTDFRTMFGLVAKGYPANNVNIILNGPDPGLQPDENEADIDTQWSGAVAPNATIDFVVSQGTEASSGVDLSAVYIVENNLAAVMSESYGYCELGLGTTGNQFFNTLWQQASAQGITVLLASGDQGSAGCDFFQGTFPEPAQFGLAVSGYASTPYNVAVGGTDFNDALNPSTYWNITNDSTTQASAKGYIPEIPWNDSCANPILSSFGLSSSQEANCNNYQLSSFVWTVGGSGGASNCTTPSGSTTTSCSGGYARPSWQTGSGTFSSDGKRDIPDVSLFAGNGFMGNFYVICQTDQTYGTCSTSSITYFQGYGGTSVASPAFAAIMALVNQKTGERQGNANYILYKLAAQQPTAFHDVNTGANAVPCSPGSPNCTTKTAGDAYGILNGYNAVTAYDMASGLGSIDANNLVTKWTSVTLLPSTTTLSIPTTTATHGQPVSFTASVKPQTGTGTPSGLVSLEGGPTSSTSGIAGFNLTNGSFSGSTEMLPGGTYSVTAHYPGDSTYAQSDSSPIAVTVNRENSQPQAFLVTFDSYGNLINGNTNTAVYGSPYILRVNVDNAAGQMCAPTAAANGTACPTGTVTLTNNGTTLDAGTYTLNNFGYVEDLTVQLPGGTDSVKSAYAGDNSFNASSATNAISITPATSFLNAPNVTSASVGNPMIATAQVQSLSNGLPPSGTVTFYSNGTAITGTTTYQGGNQVGPPAVAWTNVNFTSSTSAFTKPGGYLITASYSGDANYAPVTSVATDVSVLYPNPTITITPSTQNVNAGGTATVTALVDTTNKAVYPTGMISFMTPQSLLAGPLTCTSAKDSSGNFACQATASFSVNSAVTVSAAYSGDANYPIADGGVAQIVVNDFSISAAPSATVAQGSSAQLPINVTSLGAFNSTVSNFSCSGLPAETSCSFNPTAVTGGTGSTTLTITTTPLGQSRMMRRAANERQHVSWMATITTLPLLGLCVLGIPAWRRNRSALPLLMLVAVFVLLPSCGGSGTPPPPPNNPVPSISSLLPAQLAAGTQAPQILTINGSGFITGSTVTYNGVSHTATDVNASQLNISLGADDLATQGSYPVIVTNPAPGGGSSSAVNFSLTSGTPTGTFNVTVTASGGSLTHTTTFNLVVQ